MTVTWPLDGAPWGACPHYLETDEFEAIVAARNTDMAINVVFDGPPGPVSGRFVEVETDDGHGVSIGEWIERPDGLWALRITELPARPVTFPSEEKS